MNWWRPSGRWVFNRRQPLTLCRVAADPVRLPLECANCLEPSTQAVRCAVSGAATSTVLVPYCSRCHKALEAGKTRVTVAVCSSLVLGAGALLGVPLAAWDVSKLGYVFVTALASSLPLLLGLLFRPGTAEGQTSPDVAVWASARAMVGTNQRWMNQLAVDNNGEVTNGVGWTNLWTWPIGSGSVLLSLLAFGLYKVFYPTIVVLNLSVGEFELWVDGHKKATVGVSSLESHAAATWVTLPVGQHRLEVRLIGEGAPVRPVDVNIDALGSYLFAPGAVGHCFWTEAAAYGKTETHTTKRRLGGKDGFIVLPSTIDTWFAPNPPGNDDRHSSGGEMVALRHGRCSED